jgi:L-seryl-tRNA(Ser) seleniumtransferase
MISASMEQVQYKAEQLAHALEKSAIAKNSSFCCTVQVGETMSQVGGGAMPEQNIPSKAVFLQPNTMTVNQLEKKLRALPVPIIGRVENNHLILDMRTVRSDETDLINQGFHQAFTLEP